MPVTIIIGAQWGDEGKGRFVDWLATTADVVARFSGGDNAGHTIVLGSQVYKLHLLPSGILHPGVVALLGNGMVINPVNLVKEMDELIGQGINITPENFIISTRAHIITPAHIAFDRAKEQARGADAIGTTLRGIGPAYVDKIDRQGIRAGQMTDIEAFTETLHHALKHANHTLARENADLLDVEKASLEYLDAAARLRPYLQETAIYLNQRLKQGARIICEGAQGALLDIDHGSYPFVTSSSPSSGGALTGLGIGPTHVDRVLGIAKAFSTRVGGGPMPTEQANEIGARLRGTGSNQWDEYGTTTGRARRCGWLDLVMLRYSAAINGYTELAITKLDVLSGFDELKIAIAYELDGKRYDYPPYDSRDLERATPIYETLPGWYENITHAKTPDDLPANARAYVRRISELLELPIMSVSVGPERSQLVLL
jgi:adenylosuccinate synthase